MSNVDQPHQMEDTCIAIWSIYLWYDTHLELKEYEIHYDNFSVCSTGIHLNLTNTDFKLIVVFSPRSSLVFLLPDRIEDVEPESEVDPYPKLWEDMADFIDPWRFLEDLVQSDTPGTPLSMKQGKHISTEKWL